MERVLRLIVVFCAALATGGLMVNWIGLGRAMSRLSASTYVEFHQATNDVSSSWANVEMELPADMPTFREFKGSDYAFDEQAIRKIHFWHHLAPFCIGQVARLTEGLI